MSDPFDSISADFGAHLDILEFDDDNTPHSTFSQTYHQSNTQNNLDINDPFTDDFSQVAIDLATKHQQRLHPEPQSSSIFPNSSPISPDSNSTILVQAALEDICDRQLLYIRGKRAIVTCIDFPLIFWRYIDVEVEKQYVENFLRSDLAMSVNPDQQSLSSHFYQVTLSAFDMGKLVSTSEYHRSFHASPSIFQISLQLQQQLRAMMQQPWNWPSYDGHDHSQLLDTGEDDDWADFAP